MNFTDKFIRRQLELTKPLVDLSGLELSRSVQDKIGRLMAFSKRSSVVIREGAVGTVRTALAIPRDELRAGLILYLHGGGYTCGALDYAKGFAAVLAAETGMRVMAFEYRLAPEHPYPAALEDALAVYRHLLDEGCAAESIVLAGESAGGGLSYALALKIRALALPRPAAIIAISPWCDLTLSGASYEKNKDNDPSLSRERLAFFADSYVGAARPVSPKKRKRRAELAAEPECERLKRDAFVSPVFADLRGMPPSLILAGGDEILLSDAEMLHASLSAVGAPSRLVVKNKMWHAYLLYGLKSQKADFAVINAFLKENLPVGSQRKLRWMHLDNAAKIFPAAATSRWTNVFRLSATMTEEVDREVLQAALDVTVRRFPSIAVRLRRGTFWYYLEEIAHAPAVMDEKGYPLSRMPFDDIRECAFRVLVYKRRIAVEFFHALTDGNGGLVFLKTLVAEYIAEKYGIAVPAECGVLDRLEPPSEEELTDNFPAIAGPFPKSRRDTDSYRIFGEKEPDGFLNNTVFMMESAELLARAKEEGVTLTAFLAAAFIKAETELQNAEIVHLKNRKPVKVLIPCDLRRIYKSKSRTLRNFALYVTPGVDPRLGELSFSELCRSVSHQMALDITPQNFSAIARTNVKDEEKLALKLMPLFVKNAAMKLVFNLVGERKASLSISNLGAVTLPEAMTPYVERLDFILGVQARAPYNAGVLSYKGKTYINIIRNIREPRLEAALWSVLRSLGIKAAVESNARSAPKKS